MTSPSSSPNPVLIVGGSLVGLSAALFLASRGVKTVLVEKHFGSSTHPRAVGFTELTMEHFRAIGIGERIPQIGSHSRPRRARVASLTGNWLEETAWTPGENESDISLSSPCKGVAIAQDLLEPILRSAAVERGVDLRQGVEMVSFSQTASGVTACVKDRVTGETTDITADYMIAADGADSPVRERLGIQRHGVGHLRTIRSVLFHCAEAKSYLDQGVVQFEIEQADFRAFLTNYPDGRWVLMFSDDSERSEEELCEAIRRALGRDMPIELITTGRWEMAGRIAERYSEGRVFLVGDAAHQLPPTRAGFGANTGIDDAYNLAWKLQMVLDGEAETGLLDSYSAERQPIGWLRHQQTFARPDYLTWAGGALAGEVLYGAEAMELGQRINSKAIIGGGDDLPPAARPDEWSGQPGTRVPHVWIDLNSKRISTIDLFTQRLTLVSANPYWLESARRVSLRLGVSIQLIRAGDLVFPAEKNFAATFDIASNGALLVRPDAIVAWRSSGGDTDCEEQLSEAIAQILQRQANHLGAATP
ncbi:2,4-dichlorophenol 6-monooxygenase [Chromobacterium sinusclupearum]|uniref:2,4-dichlorophenol 6-monooxygenase n=1 Tax=Chromobacterium sinusclupearum TaxID=2077146 RepID=A0A2K4MQ78_9NEIS|nr:FAD-dependent monooxygenase [Chromobacterium sinusclupearum]POA99142.1 2,4-dichlorophenol 6-monooxygenase [Chromobacterium sinusclupearum]